MTWDAGVVSDFPAGGEELPLQAPRINSIIQQRIKIFPMPLILSLTNKLIFFQKLAALLKKILFGGSLLGVSKGLYLHVRFLWNVVVVDQLSLHSFSYFLAKFLVVECQNENLVILEGNNRVNCPDHLLDCAHQSLPRFTLKDRLPFGLLVPEIHLDHRKWNGIAFRLLQHGMDHQVKDRVDPKQRKGEEHRGSATFPALGME